MKLLPLVTVLTLGHFALTPTLSANPAAPAPKSAAKAAPKKKTPHQKLCAMLGLEPGKRYEMLLQPGNMYYYQVKELGANGWVKMQGFNNAPDQWVNLSQVISISPIIQRSPNGR